jgi:GGDEF domain-containing protein
MDALALVMWSMALGVIAALAVARLADLVARPTLSRLRAVAYHGSVFLLVLVLSGVLTHGRAPASGLLLALQVLAGPLCVGLSNFWISGWLRAGQRDRLMALVLRASAVLLPLLGLLALLLPRAQQLPAAAAISLLGGVLTLWLTVRGWLMGDRMALAMALGCLCTLPAIAGLYALAMHLVPLGTAAQALLALSAALSNALTGLVLWRRDRLAWQPRGRGARVGARDPVTHLASARTLVRRLVVALRRRRRTGRDGALLAVMVFDVERIATQVGNAGVNDMWVALATRLQRQLGVVNPVGRYWDRCFIGLVETIPSLPWLRTLGLKVAVSLRHPIEVRGLGGEQVSVQADIGVGVVHLPSGPVEVEDILHAAQRLATEARTMRSRAAMRDPVSAAVVPVEQATLARRRGWPRPAPAQGLQPLQRALR